jgi:hypothetical protein
VERDHFSGVVKTALDEISLIRPDLAKADLGGGVVRGDKYR